MLKSPSEKKNGVVHFANSDWFFYNFCQPLFHHQQKAGWDIALICPDGPYVERLREQGWPCFTIPFNRHGVIPTVEARTLLGVRKLLRKLRPNVLHNHTLKCVLYGSIASTGLSCRVVNAVNGFGYLYRAKGLGASATRLVFHLFASVFFYRKSVRFIFMNPGDREVFETKGYVVPGNAQVIPSPGVDTERFSYVEEKPGIPIAMLPARMLWSKGVAEFVEAARMLKAKGVAGRFVLVGDIDSGDSESIAPEILSGWVGEGVVEWWGRQVDMPEVLSLSSVVCLPSYGEGSPMSLIEGAACGRALVGSDIPGCRLVIGEGENGLIVPVANAERLADALASLLTDGDARRRMGKQGRDIATREFSVDTINRRTLDAYE